jgi:hypothetical protein
VTGTPEEALREAGTHFAMMRHHADRARALEPEATHARLAV